jgi:transcriptional regulator with XRE-family HTH domain
MIKQALLKKRRLAELLRNIRINAGLTQIQVADRIGESQSYVSKYESGEQRLGLIEIEEVCKAVGISLRAFIGLYLESRSSFPKANQRVLGQRPHD